MIPERIFDFEPVEHPIILADDLPVGTYVFTAGLKPIKNDDYSKLAPAVRYSLSSEETPFRVDDETGMIYSTDSLKDVGSYNLTVTAEITYNTSEIIQKTTVIPIESVKMDVDPPLIDGQEILKYDVEENTVIGTRIGDINVKNSDGGNNVFEIIGNDDAKKLFDVQNGSITVIGDIDYEKVTKLNFFVKVTNEMEKYVIIPVSIFYKLLQ